MNICLVNSNFSDDTARDRLINCLGILMLAAVLEKHNYSIKLIDLPTLVKKDILKFHKSFFRDTSTLINQMNCDIVYFDTRPDTLPLVLNTAKAFKIINPEAVLILAGVAVTFADIDILKTFNYIDLIIRGESEQTILDVLSNLISNTSMKGIQGVTFRNRSGKIIRNSFRDTINNLNLLPFPAYHLVKDTIFKEFPQEIFIAPIKLARGCRYSCTFCPKGIDTIGKERLKSPDRVISEILFFVKECNVNKFSFENSLSWFNDYERVSSLCDQIREKNITITWQCTTRPDYLNSDLLSIMSKSGLKHITWGIESGSKRIQEAIKKNINLSVIKSAIRLCIKNQISIGASFIIGFPEETVEDIDLTFELALELSVMKECTGLRIYPLNGISGTYLLDKHKSTLIYTSSHKRSNIQRLQFPEETILVKQYPMLFPSFYELKQQNFPAGFACNLSNIITIILNAYNKSFYVTLKETGIKPLYLLQKLSEMVTKRGDLLGRIKNCYPILIAMNMNNKDKHYHLIRCILDYETVIATLLLNIKSNMQPFKNKSVDPLIHSSEAIPYFPWNVIVKEFPYNPLELFSRYIKDNIVTLPSTQSTTMVLYHRQNGEVEVVIPGLLEKTCLNLIDGKKGIKTIVEELIITWQPLPGKDIENKILSFLRQSLERGIICLYL